MVCWKRTSLMDVVEHSVKKVAKLFALGKICKRFRKQMRKILCRQTYPLEILRAVKIVDELEDGRIQSVGQHVVGVVSDAV